MKQRAFIFDMDGTVVDNMGHHNRAWQNFFAGHGMALSLAEIKDRTYGKNNREILRPLFNELSDEELLAHGERKEALYRELYQPVMQPVPGLLDFLRAAQALHIPLALATAAGKPNVDFVMNNLRLAPYFKTIVSAHEVKRGKPHPDLFLAAAERLGVSPTACVVFEDAIAGIEAAHRAQMTTIALTTTYEKHELAPLPSVKKVIDDFTEVSPVEMLAV